MGLRYWVCQSCKYGHVSDTKPTKCPECGEVGGDWKSSDVTRMGRFRMYKCSNCERTVEERQPPTYPCDICGARSWRVFNGY